MSAYQCVLIAVDLSDDVAQVMEKAKLLIGADGTQVHLVHVIEPVVTDAAYDMLPALPVEFEAELLERAHQFLARIAQEYGLEHAEQHVEVGSVKGGILSLAQTVQAALIVVGTHGRHGMGLLFGSTANALLHGTPCDVLAVRIR